MFAKCLKQTSAKFHFLIFDRVKRKTASQRFTWNCGRPVWLTGMTYQSDPNTNPRSDKRDDTYCTSCIVSWGVVLAIVIAAVAFLSTGSNSNHGLSQISKAGPAPASSTTGSDTAR
jgi:hypothetical protein